LRGKFSYQAHTHPLEASLLAKALAQSMDRLLTVRIREQARCHNESAAIANRDRP